MRLFDAQAVIAATPYTALIAALADGLKRPAVSPQRWHGDPTGRGDALLLMPAWRPGHGLMGVKAVTVYPGNAARDLPAVAAGYMVFDVEDGRPLAVLDGTVLTARRTAAASALAASIISPGGTGELLIVGTGALAPELAEAHCAIGRFDRVRIWGRNPAKAARVVALLAGRGIDSSVADDLPSACSTAAAICVATTASTPILKRPWIEPGTHLSLVGAFTKDMAEADQDIVCAARLFADTRAGVVEKGGELFQAIKAGLIGADRIEADLVEMVQSTYPGIIRAPGDITLFKSVGFATLDLAAAELVLSSMTQES